MFGLSDYVIEGDSGYFFDMGGKQGEFLLARDANSRLAKRVSESNLHFSAATDR